MWALNITIFKFIGKKYCIVIIKRTKQKEKQEVTLVVVSVSPMASI